MEYRIYRQTLKIRGDTAIETIETEEVPEGYTLEVTNMGIADLTTTGQRLELGYVDQVGDYHVFYVDERTNKVETHVVGSVFIMAGEKPYGRVTTAVDGDEIYFNCHGKLWPVE